MTPAQFDWLVDEIRRVGTRRHFSVSMDAGIDPGVGKEPWRAALPPSYRSFVRTFGFAGLHRRGRWYTILLFEPTLVLSKLGRNEELIYIGGNDEKKVYFKRELLSSDQESPVFEGRGHGIARAGDDFGAWLREAASKARLKLGKRTWAQIVKGPEPFTPDELEIVEARRHFAWKVLGITPDKDLIVEVTNRSSRTLSYLSLGVRKRRGGAFGGVFLDVHDLAPGNTKQIIHGVYKHLVRPEDVILFRREDPTPEEREDYEEFRAYVVPPA